jgi:MFS-type transporter involved in bile tolerance (Atg22 family)
VAGARSLAIAVVLSGLTAALYVGTHSVVLAYLGVFGWGVDVAFFSAPSRTMLQRASPAHAHGRVLALYRTTHSAADVLAIPLTGLVIGLVGVQVAGVAVGALATVAGIIGLLAIPWLNRSSGGDPAVLVEMVKLDGVAA